MHAQMPKLRLLLTRKGRGKLKLEYEKSADSIEREMKGKKRPGMQQQLGLAMFI